ncbi:hypothetical protein ECSTECDG1313_2898 [Escherichia coli STEC_DG131-3]|nr:hypothetical protein ECSTECDG1313_2898 [Escherichia coli STEC_DG131-3]
MTLFSKNENQPAEYVTLINPNNTGKKTFMIKIFIGHYINVFYSTADITLKKQPLLFLAKLMVYSAALTFFTANFHCNMTRKINEYA